MLCKQIIDQTTGDPAVPHFTGSSMDTHGGRNPGARVFYLDPQTLNPLNYEQYRIDLSTLMGMWVIITTHNFVLI